MTQKTNFQVSIRPEGKTNTMTPEMEGLKARLKTTWMAGDYGFFAKYLEPGAFDFLGRLQIQPGIQMLDVGSGAGQIAPCRTRWCLCDRY
jgi:hypothetical protein